MIKVHIKNFQSIKDSILEIDGVTIVTGRNNGGKSAAMRAIRGVFTNTRGHSFVRYGESHCEVTITFQDGQTVTWEKGKSVNRYTVNGKVFDKVGTGVPDEVLALGVYPLQVGNQTIWPQVAPQFTGQVFLLDQPGSVIAEAISDVNRVGVLSKGLKQSEQERRQTQQDLKLRRQDKQTLESDLLCYAGLDETVAQIAQIEHGSLELQKLDVGISQQKDLRDRWEGAQEKVSFFGGLSQVALPNREALQVHQSLGHALRLQQQLTNAQGLIQAMAGVDTITLPPVLSATFQRELQAALVLQTRLDKAQKEVVREIPEGINVPALSKDIQLLPVLLPKWRGTQTQYLQYKQEVQALDSQIQQVQGTLPELEAEIQGILTQMPACPTCGHQHTQAGC